MFGLTLVGTPHPLTFDSARVPADYVQLMRTWGPGSLCAFFELPDPCEAGGRFAFMQAQFKLHAPVARAAGRWAQLTDDDLANGLVIAVHPTGQALLGLGPERFAWLERDGGVSSYRSLQQVVDRLRDEFWCMRCARYGCRILKAARALPEPATYVTEASQRSTFYAAVASVDEPAADAALARIVEVEYGPTALLALAHHLATARPGIASESRAAYVEQCLRTAKRTAGPHMDAVDIRAIRDAVKAGPVPAGLMNPLEDLVGVGVFSGEGDPKELALLTELAARPDVKATRQQLADYVQDKGERVRAEILRAETAAASPLPSAEARGLVAPVGLRAVDGAALIRDLIEIWRCEDPEADITSLTTALDALHPQERQGYAMLLEAIRWGDAYNKREPLVAEMPKAWPYLALSLRARPDPKHSSDTAVRACELLVATRTRSATPYLLSGARFGPQETKPPFVRQERAQRFAEAFGKLAGKVSARQLDELVPGLAEHPSDEAFRLAAPLLVNHATDERVFEGYLRHFGPAYPFSVRALAKRRDEPRVREVLQAQFDREQAESLRDGRTLVYTRSYGLIAAYLADLGVSGAKEAVDRYRENQRHLAVDLNNQWPYKNELD